MCDDNFHITHRNTHSFSAKRQSMKNNLDMLMAEYKLGEEIGEKYFSYMYSCLNFTFLLYGTAILVFYNILMNSKTERNAAVVYFAVFYYLLPISTYVFGLFYAYNAVVISRQGYHMIQIENDIIRLNREMRFKHELHGWDRLSKELPSGFILPYGTMLMFYIAFPWAFICFGTVFVSYDFITNPIFSLLFVKIIPFCCPTIYTIFMIHLIFWMFKIQKLYNDELANLTVAPKPAYSNISCDFSNIRFFSIFKKGQSTSTVADDASEASQEETS